MTADEIRQVLSTMDGIWPPRKPVTREERAEWVRFLKDLDGPVALRALDAMRDHSMWKPSMAFFRSAYWEAAAEPDEDLPQLPAAAGAEAPDMSDIYGHKREDWIYCWKCDMAISLDDQYDGSYWDALRGVSHHKCPTEGSAPRIPTDQLLARNEYWRKHKIGRE